MSFAQQLARTERWLARLSHVYPGTHQDYDDYVLAFFQNCWHIKDWIRNDPALPQALRDGIEKEVMNHPSLMICADMANGSKHLSLTRPRVGAGAKHSHRELKVVAGDPSQTTITYYIATDGNNKVRAMDVARDAIDAWRQILKKSDLGP
jgi:hypothetical protein